MGQGAPEEPPAQAGVILRLIFRRLYVFLVSAIFIGVRVRHGVQKKKKNSVVVCRTATLQAAVEIYQTCLLLHRADEERRSWISDRAVNHVAADE